MIFTVAVLYIAATRYLRYAKRSFATADKVCSDLSSAIGEFIEAGAPPEIAKLVIRLFAVAGCGCFVRGMLIGHFLPRITRPSQPDTGWVQAAFEEATLLEPEQTARLNRIMALTLVYDGYRNPFQGAILRRTIRSTASTHQNWGEQLETALTVFKVASHKRRIAA